MMKYVGEGKTQEMESILTTGAKHGMTVNFEAKKETDWRWLCICLCEKEIGFSLLYI